MIKFINLNRRQHHKKHRDIHCGNASFNCPGPSSSRSPPGSPGLDSENPGRGASLLTGKASSPASPDHPPPEEGEIGGEHEAQIQQLGVVNGLRPGVELRPSTVRDENIA